MKQIAERRLTSIVTDNMLPGAVITSSGITETIVRKFFHEDITIYESFFILLLDRQNKTIGWAKISQGGVAGTVVDPKIVAKYAVDALASGVILCHNHPSGNLKPSVADKEITEKMKKGLGFLDIHLIDHMILTESGYTSFADEGLI